MSRPQLMSSLSVQVRRTAGCRPDRKTISAIQEVAEWKTAQPEEAFQMASFVLKLPLCSSPLLYFSF